MINPNYCTCGNIKCEECKAIGSRNMTYAEHVKKNRQYVEESGYDISKEGGVIEVKSCWL